MQIAKQYFMKYSSLIEICLIDLIAEHLPLHQDQQHATFVSQVARHGMNVFDGALS